MVLPQSHILSTPSGSWIKRGFFPVPAWAPSHHGRSFESPQTHTARVLRPLSATYRYSLLWVPSQNGEFSVTLHWHMA